MSEILEQVNAKGIPYREGLPEVPQRMRRLPVDRGYPVPWFVVRLDRHDRPVDGRSELPGDHWEFRVADDQKRALAMQQGLCWVCGVRLGVNLTFVLGPMCTVSRTTSEPACHWECAKFSAVACPFLTQRESGYRDGGLPPGVVQAAGCPILRQPGVMALWTTKEWTPFEDGQGGVLIRIGEPDSVTWWSRGRTAMRTEIHESVATGIPKLYAMAFKQAADERDMTVIVELNRQLDVALRLVP